MFNKKILFIFIFLLVWANAFSADFVVTSNVDSGSTALRDALTQTQYPVYQVTTTAACFGMSNGSITVTIDALVKSVRWVNSRGLTVGNNTSLTNIPAGIYGLYLTDQSGVETFYNNYTVDEVSKLQLLPGSAQIVNDHCSLGAGSIKGIEIAGGQLPYTYQWTDAGGKTVASTADVTGLLGGDYTLTVKDASSCNTISASYTVQDMQLDLPAPFVSNPQLCSPGQAFLAVNDPLSVYTYRLYANENDPMPIDTQPTGKFTIAAKSTIKFYVSAVMGSCESSRTEVTVFVGISGITIANTITPNGDGINDYWNIAGIQTFPGSLVQIFTRNGQRVFESKGYAVPFDGTSGGKELPNGVYYYVINLGINCSLLSGSLTILR